MIVVDADCLASVLFRVPKTEKGRCVYIHMSCLKPADQKKMFRETTFIQSLNYENI
jgi:hypothetical protein